ncbi:MAG TPA: DNA-binding protein Alba [archaeon]|nr:DNA-binding protein Alba [archaeon]
MAGQDGVVFIGTKSPMSYVLAVVTQFHGGLKQVQIKARGKAISRAVDVAEIVRNRFMADVKISEIKTGTETIKGEKGEDINVSSIEITLSK